VEALRTVYGPSVFQELFLDIEMAVDGPVVVEVPFTTVTNKKHKDEGKASSTADLFSPQNMLPTIPAVVSRALPLCLQPVKIAATKPTLAKVATAPQASKTMPKSFA